MPDHTNDPFEPIDSELHSLADSAARSAHGVAPAEVRARGARRHRRRVGAVGALAALAIVAVGTVAVGAGRDLAGQQVGPATQGTEDTPDTLALTDADLPADTELPGFNEITGWRTTDTFPGDGQAPISACQQETLAGLGADEVRTRHYRQTTDYPRGTTPDPDAVPGRTGISIAQFADEAAAQEAFETVRSWIEQCKGGGDAVNLLGSWGSEASEGWAWLVIYPAQTGNPDDGVLDGEAVGIAGSRIVLISQTEVGQDYNYPDGSTPIEAALTIALDRLPAG